MFQRVREGLFVPGSALRIAGVVVGLALLEQRGDVPDDVVAGGAAAGQASADHVGAGHRHAEIPRPGRLVPLIVPYHGPVPLIAASTVDDGVVVVVEPHAHAVHRPGLRVEPPADLLGSRPLDQSPVEDLIRRVEILLDLHGRHREGAAVVVEAARGRILGKGRRVEVDADEIADRVPILRPVEPAQHDRLFPIRHLGGHRLLRNPIDHRGSLGGIGLRPVLRGHLMGVEDVDDLPPLAAFPRSGEVGAEVLSCDREIPLGFLPDVALGAVLAKKRHHDGLIPPDVGVESRLGSDHSAGHAGHNQGQGPPSPFLWQTGLHR